MTFADRLNDAITTRKSCLVAGLDPQYAELPAELLAEAKAKSASDDEFIYNSLTSFYDLVLEALAPHIAAVKPNIAFFEQYGLPGISAFHDVVNESQGAGVLVIADGKRGDIGSTAEAYSRAFLGQGAFGDVPCNTFNADALTVNPYLGFDTLEPFLKDCEKHGKGIFVLVKTSNPGSHHIQGEGKQHTISEKVAAWLGEQSARLMGKCGLSGLGAVIGATYPEEAASLRQLAPKNYFLIPGMGAQGASAKDAVSGFTLTKPRRGGVINVSRGLFGGLAQKPLSEIKALLVERATQLNQQINDAVA